VDLLGTSQSACPWAQREPKPGPPLSGRGSYDPSMPSSSAPLAPLSQRERWALCDLLTELGPDVPTLCEGWRSADLAAHLVVRDHRPDAIPGMVVRWPPLAAWTDRAQRRARDRLTWDALVQRARSGPPLLLKPLDSSINTIEYFIHHEDLRRAQPDWQPRSLDLADEAALWRYLRFVARTARPAVGRVEAPGREPMILSKQGHGITLRGPVGELALWLTGRKAAARVDVVAG
jgi:uncharacterized protein (TIGR03085 family)